MKNRIVFLDYLRVIACLMVMVVHVPLLSPWAERASEKEVRG